MEMADHDDPILDALLAEALRGISPPDLTPRILHAWNTGDRIASARPLTAQQPLLADVSVPEPPPILTGLNNALTDTAKTPIVSCHRAARSGSGNRRSLTPLFITASVCAAVVALAIGATALIGVKQPHVAHNSPARSPLSPDDIAVDRSAPTTELPQSSPQPDVAALTTSTPSVPSTPSVLAPEIESPAIALTTKPSSDKGTAPNAPAPVVVVARAKPTLSRAPDEEITSFVNAELNRTWTELSLKPAPLATDAQWCERLFVRVLGRNPTTDELKALADDKTSDRREKLVDRLLTGSSYADALARHWSRVWTQVFLGRSGGQGGSWASRDELAKYFQAALAADKRLDQIAEELLTATGGAQPDADDYNPAVNFLLDWLDTNATVPTARVARVLLGHQLQCAQCHDHPTQGWSQEQFWALNAFFRQMRAERRDDGVHLVNVDFRGQGRGTGGEVFYETPDGLVKTAFPRFLDGTELPKSGQLAIVDRRRELARLVSQSDDLAKAAVNRVWAHFFDYGFTRPVDDLGPNSSPPATQALDRLATQFAAHDYDLKALIRWIVLSDPFQRSSKMTDLASKDMPEEGELAFFSRYYARPQQTAGVQGLLVQAARIRKSSPTEIERAKARLDWLEQFSRRPTKGGKVAGGGESSLMIKTGDPIRRPASGDPSGLVKKLAASPMQFDKKVEHLFLAALARQPTPRDRQAAQQVLASGGDNPAAALEDIWWSLLNSNECVFDH